MNSNEEKISALQLGILVIVSVIGIGILTLPRVITEIADTDGWMLIIVGGAVTIALALIMNSLGNMFPDKTIIEYSRDLVGGPLSYLIGIILIIYFTLIAAFSIRIFGEVLKMYLLPKTPIEIIIMTFLITVIYLVRNNLEGIARFYEIIILIMFIPYFLALFAGTGDLDYSNLLPVFQTSPKVILGGILQIVFSFSGFEVIYLFIPFVSDKKNIKRTLIIVISITTIIYLISSLIVIASFGPQQTKALLWPLMAYIKSIEVPGAFIEQLEGVIMTIWVLFIFTTIATLYFSSVFILGRLTKVREHKIFPTALLPLIYIISLQPANVPELYQWLGTFSTYAGSVVIIILPVILLIIAKIQKKGVKSNV